MYVAFIKHEIYIERRNGPVVWKPLFESGEEGLVIVFLVFWIAVNRKCLYEEEDTYRETQYGTQQDK
jgi:hypothetical protein